MTLRGTLIPVLCAVTVNAVAVNAVAAPHLSVTTNGDCPDRAMLVSTMTAKGLTVPPASEPVSYALTIRALRGGATLQLSDASGASVIERQFASTDCRALADAMAVVVEAYFVDLGTLGDRPRPASPPRTLGPQPATAPRAPVAPSAPETNTATQDAAGSRPKTPEAPEAKTAAGVSSDPNRAATAQTPKNGASTVVSTPISARKAIATNVPDTKPLAAAPSTGSRATPSKTSNQRASTNATSYQPQTAASNATSNLPPPAASNATSNQPQPAASNPASTATPQTKKSNASEWSNVYPRGFLGIGGLLALPASAGSTMTFDIGVGLDLMKFPISPEFVFASTLPVITGERPDRVQRWANQGLLRVSAPFASRVRVRPWAALGMTLVRLQELDLPPPPPVKTTRSFVIGAGVELGVPILDIWSARFDLGCTVLTERDGYYVQVERIGAGPWATCHAVLGFAVGGKAFSP